MINVEVFNVSVIVDLVKRGEVTLVGEIRCYRNDRYYYHDHHYNSSGFRVQRGRGVTFGRVSDTQLWLSSAVPFRSASPCDGFRSL